MTTRAQRGAQWHCSEEKVNVMGAHIHCHKLLHHASSHHGCVRTLTPKMESSCAKMDMKKREAHNTSGSNTAGDTQLRQVCDRAAARPASMAALCWAISSFYARLLIQYEKCESALANSLKRS